MDQGCFKNSGLVTFVGVIKDEFNTLGVRLWVLSNSYIRDRNDSRSGPNDYWDIDIQHHCQEQFSDDKSAHHG